MDLGGCTPTRHHAPLPQPHRTHPPSPIHPLAKYATRPLRWCCQLFNFGGAKKTVKQAPKVTRPTVVPTPSFNVPLGLLAISGLSAYEGATPLAAIAGLLGVFLAIQATRVK